jgi:biotin operon repressor
MDDRYIQNRKDPKYDGLLSLIPIGQENAISQKSLARLTDSSLQEIRQWVENARLDGMIIASSQFGYYIPIDEEELVEYYVRTKRRLNTTRNTLTPVIKRLEDQR